MARVKNKNRVLQVDAKSVDSYLKRGYDEIDDNGKIKKKATGGYTVSPAKYNKALEEIEKLEKENKKLKADLKKAQA